VEPNLELYSARSGVSAQRDPGLRSSQGGGILRWQANPLGRPPVKYRVYGSDEKGFTIADKKYQGIVGVSKEEMSSWSPWFPANFIAETTAAELPVLGSAVDLPAANKTFYRVVAVDEQDQRSGPSDYATAPRPVIYSRPVLNAEVGTEYRYQLSANRSLGDLSARMADTQQVKGYFDIEKPKFALQRGPRWLKIDEATGVLSGTPDAAGKLEVAVAATIVRDVRKLDEAALQWGREKLLSVTTEQVGSATQEFVIDVQQRRADVAAQEKGKGLKIFMLWDRMTAAEAAQKAAQKPGVRRVDPYTVEARVPEQCDVLKWITGTGLEMSEGAKRYLPPAPGLSPARDVAP
jgi:hypothetical protein